MAFRNALQTDSSFFWDSRNHDFRLPPLAQANKFQNHNQFLSGIILQDGRMALLCA